MKLLRIRLHDFRGVHDREVTLAEHGVTVLQGDNEVGKTSTVQALDLLFDVPDSSRKAEVLAAAPTHVDAGPEVEAEVVSGPYRFVYRKRWIRRPITELTVLAPAREQLTGRDAHARVTTLLDETVDRDLWKALRIEQHTPLGQADLGGKDALARALDQAAGGTGAAANAPAGTDDHGLVERAEAEARRYVTAGGRSTGELRAAETRLEQARAELARCRDAVAAVERDVAERDRLDAEAAVLAARRRQHHAEVARLEDRWTALQARLREVETAHEHAVLARERAASARDRRVARDTLASAVATAAETADGAAARLAEHEHGHAATREHRDARHVEHEQARAEAGARRGAARTADDALARAHDHVELTDLDARLRRVEEAEAGLHAAERALAGSVVDQDALDHLEELALEVVRAEAARDAGAAGVELEAPSDLDVVVDGTPTHLDAGAVRRFPVAGPVDVTVPGVLDVRVRPGRDAHGLADTVREARDALAAACAEVDVADVEAARAALRRAVEARRRREEHRATLDRELAGRGADDVRTTRERLRARVAGAAHDTADDSDRDAVGALPDLDTGALPDLDTARAAAAAAREEADTAAARAEEVDQRRREADDAVRAGDTEAALLAQRAADARHDHERRAAELVAARSAVDDAAVRADETDRGARARDAENDHERLAASLAAEDPHTVETLVDNARKVRERDAAESADLERARDQATGRLQNAGFHGWHDQLSAATAEAELAERAHTAVARRSRAALRLHRTLARHRDEVRRAYVAPFREQVERLARIVFGPTLSLEVDPRLHITHRTLDGVTVAFDELSSGAKEQLGLCARLACAALVDPADGVPVVIDDALGHCDPARLARLGAVFTAATSGAGSAGQVVVLTCTPERYRGVGAATVVQLTASRSTPVHAPAVGAGQDQEANAGASDAAATDVGEGQPTLGLPEAG